MSDLSRSLLKDFANVTNSKKDEVSKYVKGTIKGRGEAKYVQLDGSNSATPITGVVDVEENDRVLVSIENHSATIIGNFTFPPSARKEQEALDKADEAGESANLASEKAQEASKKAEEAVSESSIASALANEAKENAKEAIDAAEDAITNANAVKGLADEANANAAEAKENASKAQADVANANAEIEKINGEVTTVKGDIADALTDLGNQADEIGTIKETYSTKLETDKVKADLTTEITKKVGELQSTVTENYAAKTDLVDMEGKLQSQITQNAEGLSSQVSKTEKLETDTAKAQEDVNKALENAEKAQNSADTAIKNAEDAKKEAEEAEANAKIASEAAQASRDLADQAEEVVMLADKTLAESRIALDEAEKNLAFVVGNPDSTEAEIAEAQGKVDNAQIVVNAALEDVAEANYAADQAIAAAEQAEQDAATAMTLAGAANSRAYQAKLAADKAMRDSRKAQAEVAALTLKITNAETKIDQNSEAIELSAKKTEEIGDSLKNDYYSKTETEAAIKVSADGIKSTVTETVKTEVGKIDLGIRNLALNSKYEIDIADEFLITKGLLSEPWVVGETYSITAKGKMVNSNDMFSGFGLWRDEEGLRAVDTSIWLNEEKDVYVLTFKCPEADEADTLLNTFSLRNYPEASAVSSKLEWVKIVRGSKVLYDWTPAPEDTDDAINDASKDLNDRLDKTNTSLSSAKSVIDQLADQITHLVVDENGSSLMTQTPDGWRFDMSSVTGNIDAVKEEMGKMETEHGEVDELVNGMKSTVDSIDKKTAYIDVEIEEGTGKPKMILGASNSEFRVEITNTGINFMQGSTVVAYVSNNKFYSPQMLAVNSIQIGEGPGYKFETRSNGNLGLVYIANS